MAKLEEVVLRDTTGNRPAAGIAGRLFFDETLEKLQRDTGAVWEDVEGAGSGSTFKSKVSANDTTEDYLENKVVEGTNISVTVLNEGGNEQLEIAASGVERYYTFSIPGNLTVAAGVFRLYNLTGAGLTINKVHIAVNTAPTGATILVDVNENGTTIFTTQSNRPEIAISGFTGSSTTIEEAAWDNDNYLIMDVDQIGSAVTGADLTATIIVL